MSEENKTVESQVETAVAQSEVDYEAQLKAKDEEIAKVQAEKENYRKGMLKAKGKLPEEEEDTPEELDEKIRRIAREEALTTREAQLQAEKDAIYSKTLKRNKELELALKNRGQVTSTSAAGSNEERTEVKTDTFFSADQINYFKSKGWDDKKIEQAKKNMLKGANKP